MTHSHHLAPLAAAALLTCCGLLGCNSTKESQDPAEVLQMHREFALRYYDENELDRAEHQVDLGLEIAPRDCGGDVHGQWLHARLDRLAEEPVLLHREAVVLR